MAGTSPAMTNTDYAASRFAAPPPSSPASISAEADALDLGAADLDQRRPHHRARQFAEQHQRFLHAVVHVD